MCKITTVTTVEKDGVSVADFGAPSATPGGSDVLAFQRAAESVADGKSVTVTVPSGIYSVTEPVPVGARNVLWHFSGQSELAGLLSNLPGTKVFDRDPVRKGVLWESPVPVVGSAFTHVLRDSAVVPGGFAIGHAVLQFRSGGAGHRESFTARLTSDGAGVGEFLVGSGGYSIINTGSGNAFGMNAYVQVMPEASASAEAGAIEVNTDVRRSVVRKVGVQVIDVDSSKGDGTGVSAAVLVATQPGAQGWQTGLQFGSDAGAGVSGVRGSLIRTGNAAAFPSLQRGVDFRSVSFGAAAIDLKAGGGPTGGIYWDSGAGGKIESQTAGNGPQVIFANHVLVVRDNASVTTVLQVNTAPGAQAVSVLIPGVGLRQILAGPPDSAGPGFRSLRCTN